MAIKDRDLPPFALARLGWVLCLGLGALGAVLLIWAQSVFQAPALSLAGAQKYYAIQSSMRYRLDLVAARAQWTAMAILMVSAGASALLFTALTLIRFFPLRDLLRCGIAIPIFAAPVAFWFYAESILRPLPAGQSEGFLSLLVASIAEAERPAIHKEVMAMRLVGEGAAIALALTAGALATFTRIIYSADLAARFQAFRNALYASSVLFVSGVAMSRANFSWVLAHWDVRDAEQLKAIASVVTAGVIQSGVGYSALLLCVFGPCRMLLELKLLSSMSLSERSSWRTDHDLETSLRAEARQLFAILAPVLSAPIFDAVARL